MECSFSAWILEDIKNLYEEMIFLILINIIFILEVMHYFQAILMYCYLSKIANLVFKQKLISIHFPFLKYSIFLVIYQILH